MQLNINHDSCSWLVDTGASLSAIRYEKLIQLNIPFQLGSIKINGVCGELYSEGFVHLSLTLNGKQFVHKFHVFRDLCFTNDGILGLDFLNKYNGKLNLELNTLTLRNYYDEEITLQLQTGSKSNNEYIRVPPRCESIHFVRTCMKDECVIFPTELCEGVFLAGSIAKPINDLIPTQTLNTRDSEVSLGFFSQEIDSLNNYNILS